MQKSLRIVIFLLELKTRGSISRKEGRMDPGEQLAAYAENPKAGGVLEGTMWPPSRNIAKKSRKVDAEILTGLQNKKSMVTW